MVPGPVAPSFAHLVTAGYFEAMGIRLRQGRVITAEDEAGRRPVAVVNEAAAEVLWPGQEPLGRRLRIGPQGEWLTVVGVVDSVVASPVSHRPARLVYASLAQAPGRPVAFLTRLTGDPAPFAEELRAQVRAVRAWSHLSRATAAVRYAAGYAPLLLLLAAPGAAADSWTAIGTTQAPTARYAHTAVWTGSRMIVWGEPNYPEGGVYDPATDTWTATTTLNAPIPRYFHTAVWSGSKMLVWGGLLDPSLTSYTNTGALYAPTGTQGPLVAGTARVFPLIPQCGIPDGAEALSVSLAVTQPTAAGNLRLYPAGTPLSTVSSINYSAGQTRSGGARSACAPPWAPAPAKSGGSSPDRACVSDPVRTAFDRSTRGSSTSRRLKARIYLPAQARGPSNSRRSWPTVFTSLRSGWERRSRNSSWSSITMSTSTNDSATRSVSAASSRSFSRGCFKARAM